MIHFVVFILFQFNFHYKDWIFKEKLYDWHACLNLRDQEDWTSNKNITLETLIKESIVVRRHNYPDLAWAYNFNCWGTCCTRPALDFNLKYQIHCMIQMEFGTESKINAYAKCLQEARELYEIYNLLDDVFYQSYTVFDKRKSLYHLREKIGEKNFYSGRLPPPVPIWRFELFD